MARVLLVDDDEIARLILGSLLYETGHEVVYAGDGERALNLYRRGIFDVVITDLAMPKINGLRLIQELMELDPTLPVIAISGGNADQLLLAEDFGARETLMKPVAPSKVLKALEEATTDCHRDVWDQAWG
jgi:CheY-like chemotaxis protein